MSAAAPPESAITTTGRCFSRWACTYRSAPTRPLTMSITDGVGAVLVAPPSPSREGEEASPPHSVSRSAARSSWIRLPRRSSSAVAPSTGPTGESGGDAFGDANESSGSPVSRSETWRSPACKRLVSSSTRMKCEWCVSSSSSPATYLRWASRHSP